jgi:hypothetical protein
MAQMHKSVATLRIVGDDLVPTDVSRLLNCTPTTAQKKGDVIVGKSGLQRIARNGMWSLQSEDQQPENLDGQIEEILGKLTANMEVWQALARRFRLDLFCGLFMSGGNEGLSISPTSLLSLGLRGILLGLDVYGPE